MRFAPFVGLTLLIQIATAAGPARAKDDPLRQWLDGPVHYLITPEEIKEFKAQKTDADRVAFIERFWRRRDPTPDTLSNEYRQLFWNRVKETNEKFLDSPGPGWKTDRGKIYILYGPPDEEKEDVNAHAGSDADDSKGLIRWVYLKPGGRRDVDPVVYVPFVRDVTGEYRLSYDPALSSPFFNWNAIDDRRTAGLNAFMSGIQPGSKDPIGVRLDLGKMQEVPPQEKFLMDSVESVETFAYQPLPLTIDRFRLDGGGCVTVLTVAIPGPADSVMPALMARFARKGADTKVHLLGEGSFRVEDTEAHRIAQARVVLEPGTWDLTVLAVDPASGVSRIFKGKVATLPANAPLLLSDVVLARALEPLPFATQASYDAPYIVGGFRVAPRVPEVVPRGEPVRVFYEIYGGTSPYHVVYQLEGQEDDGRWRALGRPQEREATTRGQGYELPTSATWPFGAYRMRIRVIDAAGVPAEASTAFALAADDVVRESAAPAPVVRDP